MTAHWSGLESSTDKLLSLLFQGKMAAKRVKKEKKTTTVKQEKRYFNPGEVIELSE